MEKANKILILSVLAGLCLFNYYRIIANNHQFIPGVVLASSFSAGDRYFGRLCLWYYYAQKGDWTQAYALEPGLDKSDIVAYKRTNDPNELKKDINNLMIKPQKTVEDLLEISRIEKQLGKNAECLQSLDQAKNLDPVRDDISQIYYNLNR